MAGLAPFRNVDGNRIVLLHRRSIRSTHPLRSCRGPHVLRAGPASGLSVMYHELPTDPGATAPAAMIASLSAAAAQACSSGSRVASAERTTASSTVTE